MTDDETPPDEQSPSEFAERLQDDRPRREQIQRTIDTAKQQLTGVPEPVSAFQSILELEELLDGLEDD